MNSLPHDKAVKGAAFEIEYFGEKYLVVVAGVGYAPLYDPENLKPRSWGRLEGNSPGKMRRRAARRFIPRLAGTGCLP